MSEESDFSRRSVDPSKDIDKFFLQNGRITVGAACCQGRRSYMQDVFSVILSNNLDKKTDFITVCDGHDIHGDRVARYIAQELCDTTLKDLIKHGWNDYQRIIKDAFLRVDSDMRATPNIGGMAGGSTCVSLWMSRGQMYSAHVGDSRTFVSVNRKVVDLTKDHTPTRSKEKARIEAAGGFVYDERVNGILAVSRSFGDYEFKSNRKLDPTHQMVNCLPDVKQVTPPKDLDFVVLCSDGVHNAVPNQDIVNFIHGKLAEKLRADDIAKQLLISINDPSANSVTGFDNCTIVIAIPKPDFFKE